MAGRSQGYFSLARNQVVREPGRGTVHLNFPEQISHPEGESAGMTTLRESEEERDYKIKMIPGETLKTWDTPEKKDHGSINYIKNNHI